MSTRPVPTPDILADIRDDCRLVAETSAHVRVAHDRIPALAKRIAASASLPLTFDYEHHFVGEPEETASYLVVLDSVNFGSGFFPHLRKTHGSGYYTIAASLAERFRSYGSPTADDLAQLTSCDCARLFHQSMDLPARRRLMDLFAQALRSLGNDLNDRFGGSPVRLIERAERSVGRLVQLLHRQPFFRDVSRYGTLEVPFYKRAQILASDLSLALGDHDLGRFEDIDQCTAFADNLVPHVLRRAGVLRYDDALAERIDSGRSIPHHSAAEVEIRACAVHAVESMVHWLRRRGISTTARKLDVILWERGQNPEIKKHPRHRTRTVCY